MRVAARDLQATARIDIPRIREKLETRGVAGDRLELGTQWVTPDYQDTLTLGKDGKPTASWYDVKGTAGGVNRDAEDLAKLAGGNRALYRYLTEGKGPVDIYVGGVGVEQQAWVPPIPSEGKAPSFALNYALDAHTGPGKSFWWPVGEPHQASSLLPYDGWEGIPNLQGSVDYGAYLLDRLISKVEAAGASEVRVFAHSKGSMVAGTALHDPQGRYDRLGDGHVAPMMTFGMPFVFQDSPMQWAGKSQAPHWGGFWRAEGGRLLMYNRDSDFVTYGGWIDMGTHDYSHLVQDSWLGPYAGNRGKSPAWTPTENFMARYRAFAASGAISDQSPATMSYDW